MRRFLQHVLPKGFQRVRHYGWLAAAAKAKRERIHALLDWKAPPPQLSTLSPQLPQCPCCKKPMALIGMLPRSPPDAEELLRTAGTGELRRAEVKNDGDAAGGVLSRGGKTGAKRG